MTASPPATPSSGGRLPDSPLDGGGAGGNGDPAEPPLTGIGILVTRPREQATGLMQRLEQLGARPILFSALAILPPLDTARLRETLRCLDEFDQVIFISPTAAQRGVAAVQALRPWPRELAVAAVGRGTAQALCVLGITGVVEPSDGADSDHLLALPGMQDVAGKRILIFRGEDGREALAETLRQRGARVTYAECYRRGLPESADPAPVLELFRTDGIQAVTAYSSETLDNLLQLLGYAGRDFLLKTPLFVPHPRIAAHAASVGIATVITARPPGQELTASLVEYFAHD